MQMGNLKKIQIVFTYIYHDQAIDFLSNYHGIIYDYKNFYFRNKGNLILMPLTTDPNIIL